MKHSQKVCTSIGLIVSVIGLLFRDWTTTTIGILFLVIGISLTSSDAFFFLESLSKKSAKKKSRN